MTSQNDALYRKWDSWIDILDAEILNLHTQRYIYNEVIEMVRDKPVVQEGNAFMEWVFFWYSSSMAISVRKQADNDKNCISYRRLLESIKLNPQVISRDRFLQNFVDANYTESDAGLCFEQLVSPGASYLNPAVVQAEIDDLRRGYSKAMSTSVSHITINPNC